MFGGQQLYLCLFNLIKLQLCETALWESYDFYETDNLDIELFEVYNQEGLIEFDISDEEILGHLKY